jgi:HAD superfamily hydrolase (TIGR01484 family)
MMQPLSECPETALRALRGVLTDIDDTITTDGRLTAESYAAMERIERAGLAVIPITGRPAGWCDHIARMWPVAAVVGENGAFWFRYDRIRRRMIRHFTAPEEERRANSRRLGDVAAEILRAVPSARIASDQLYREADLAIDFCEDVERLPEHDVARIVALMRERGLTVKVSSIHVNGWFGRYDKLSATLDLLVRELGAQSRLVREEYAFVGDSPNDEPMFGHFSLGVGVANVRDFPEMRTLPRYVTIERAGKGFAEFADRLVRARTRP